ncbi:MAG: hypothetical protein U0168_05290 [Nannocystaceae bacterium]
MVGAVSLVSLLALPLSAAVDVAVVVALVPALLEPLPLDPPPLASLPSPPPSCPPCSLKHEIANSESRTPTRRIPAS